MGVLDEWQLSRDELNEIVGANPSLRGFLFGYAAEYKLKKLWFSDNRVSGVKKYDNHDRTQKGDISLVYQGVEMKVEVKGLQTHSIRETKAGFTATFQCDASDRRPVKLPNGKKVETTCLLVNEFDLLAVCIFQFARKWAYAFAKNTDLPRTKHAKYTPAQRAHLLATSMAVTWPLEPPFREEPFVLLDELAASKAKGVKLGH